MTSDGTGGVRRDRVRREGFPVVLMTIVKPLMRCYRVGASIGCSNAGRFPAGHLQNMPRQRPDAPRDTGCRWLSTPSALRMWWHITKHNARQARTLPGQLSSGLGG